MNTIWVTINLCSYIIIEENVRSQNCPIQFHLSINIPFGAEAVFFSIRLAQKMDYYRTEHRHHNQYSMSIHTHSIHSVFCIWFSCKMCFHSLRSHTSELKRSSVHWESDPKSRYICGPESYRNYDKIWSNISPLLLKWSLRFCIRNYPTNEKESKWFILWGGRNDKFHRNWVLPCFLLKSHLKLCSSERFESFKLLSNCRMCAAEGYMLSSCCYFILGLLFWQILRNPKNWNSFLKWISWGNAYRWANRNWK